MELPGITRKLVGMCYNTSVTSSSYGSAAGSLMLRVPFIPQKHANLCSDAAALMILRAWGYQTTRDTNSNFRAPFEGSNVAKHTDFAAIGPAVWGTYASWQVPASASDLLDFLAIRGPTAAAVNSKLGGHVVVLIGVYSNNGEVVYHDPWTGPMRFAKFPDFRKRVRDLTYLDKVSGIDVNPTGANWAH